VVKLGGAVRWLAVWPTLMTRRPAQLSCTPGTPPASNQQLTGRHAPVRPGDYRMEVVFNNRVGMEASSPPSPTQPYAVTHQWDCGAGVFDSQKQLLKASRLPGTFIGCGAVIPLAP
jgi:hypothetical protein